jgi:uncharacterized protein (DUF2236 family)
MLRQLQKLLEPPHGLKVDFRHPEGAPALVPAHGVSWRIFANPVTLFIGGVAAVLLELAHPQVRSGVWEHSSFRTDPLGRLHRTGYAALVTVYAPRDTARGMIDAVVRRHEQVQGNTPKGMPYHANDPQLLRWVQATAVFGFTEAFHRYATRLRDAEKSAAFAEGTTSARMYGAKHTPQDWAQWELLLRHTAAQLEGHAILAEFLQIMTQAPLMPVWLRPLQRLLLCAAVDITPEPVRSLPQLEGYRLGRTGRVLVRGLARMAGALPIPQWPATLAAQRMGGTH